MIALGRSLSRVRHLVNPVLGLAIVVGVGPLPVRRVDAQQPVVFVHGLTSTGNSWITLPNYVNTNFNSTVLTPTLGWSATYETQSANLTGALAGYLSAVAISHSNGSIVTRRYLVDNGALGSRIDRHLSIGGLHRGARLAEKVRSGKFLTWLGELLTFIYDPFQYYFLADPAFAASPVATDWDVDVSGFLATFIDPGPSGNLSLDKARDGGLRCACPGAGADGTEFAYIYRHQFWPQSVSRGRSDDVGRSGEYRDSNESRSAAVVIVYREPAGLQESDEALFVLRAGHVCVLLGSSRPEPPGERVEMAADVLGTGANPYLLGRTDGRAPGFCLGAAGTVLGRAARQERWGFALEHTGLCRRNAAYRVTL